MKRRLFPAAFKKLVVTEALKGKKSLSEIAMTHNLHPNQIKNWKSQLFKQMEEVFKDRRIDRTRNNEQDVAALQPNQENTP